MGLPRAVTELRTHWMYSELLMTRRVSDGMPTSGKAQQPAVEDDVAHLRRDEPQMREKNETFFSRIYIVFASSLMGALPQDVLLSGNLILGHSSATISTASTIKIRTLN